MNAYYTTANRKSVSAPTATTRQYVSGTSPSRPPRRERDFGVGYGTSSGYATTRHYVPNNAARLFRCV